MKIFIWVLLLTLGGLAPAWADDDAAADTTTASTPNPRYVIKGGEVYDKNTNLTWQRCSVGQEWKEGTGCTGTIKVFAFDQTQQLNSGEWRVPTQDELASLMDHSHQDAQFPTIDAVAFPGMSRDAPTYWSSTPDGDARAWDARFAGGDITDDVRGYRFAVRLVRKGQ
jgi:Protein of unknown function (DUF1566)